MEIKLATTSIRVITTVVAVTVATDQAHKRRRKKKKEMKRTLRGKKWNVEVLNNFEETLY